MISNGKCTAFRLKGAEGERLRGGALGLGLLMGGAVFSFGFSNGCRKAEILAIKDDGKASSKINPTCCRVAAHCPRVSSQSLPDPRVELPVNLVRSVLPHLCILHQSAARAESMGDHGMLPYFGEVCRCMAQAVGAILLFLWLHSSPRSWRQRSARHPRPAGLGGRWAAHGCQYRGAAPAVDICNP